MASDPARAFSCAPAGGSSFPGLHNLGIADGWTTTNQQPWAQAAASAFHAKKLRPPDGRQIKSA